MKKPTVAIFASNCKAIADWYGLCIAAVLDLNIGLSVDLLQLVFRVSNSTSGNPKCLQL